VVLVRDTSSPSLWATGRFFAGGEDVSLTLTLRPPVAFRGRVEFDSAAGVGPRDLSAVRVSLRGVDVIPSARPSLALLADGTISTANVVPGRYRLQVNEPWSVRSVTAGGQDLTDLPFAIDGPTGLDGVSVTLTDRTAGLSGTVSDPSGRSPAGACAVLFPVDRRHWTLSSRRFPMPLRVGGDGVFHFQNLPAGVYHALALAACDPQDVYEDARLAGLAARAGTVTLREGDALVRNLTSELGQ
jgi:hypothetical protein